ncbi:GspH/FimT family pseudopilin [Pseudomonas nitroreducens]|uniref:GspH/FimT family pseudopilin n=1 Tax=Pseudomonas nitroreducens TaxID=46680 RepID=UPI00351CF47C
MTVHLRQAAGGFTLIELMVTIAVAAILISLAVPSFNDATLSGKLAATANDLVAGVALGRSEAIKRNALVSMCASSDGSTCASSGGWEQGWIILTNTAVVIQKHAAAPVGFKISAKSSDDTVITKIDFQPAGFGNDQATVTVCRATPSVGSQQRQVQVDATGRAYVKKTTGTSCS